MSGQLETCRCNRWKHSSQPMCNVCLAEKRGEQRVKELNRRKRLETARWKK